MARDTAGNLRSDVGYFTILTREASGHEERYRGKFLKIWRRDGDGVWRIRMESYSSATNS